MDLHQLMDGISYEGGLPDAKGIPKRDSRSVGSESVFFAIPGTVVDGHDYAKAALDAGAVAIVVEKDLKLPRQILVADTLVAYSLACANYFGRPAESLTLIGVTGTNGKTTVTYLIQEILKAAGLQVGMIGTIQNIIGDMIIPARHTTPDPFQLQSLFSRMVEAGCTHVIMEVSSHAMIQKRVEGCHFSVSAFTNLSQDHLDYHGTMEAYFAAKKELFSITDRGVYNLDDSYGKKLLAEDKKGISFSVTEPKASLYAKDIRFSEKGSHFLVVYEKEELAVDFVQPGLFSVSNALTALGVALSLDIPFSTAVKGLEETTGVAGRFEFIPAQMPFTVVRDFAHSPDGLEKLLSTIKSFSSGRIITLFGCAGVRDRTKRPAMAEAVARYSDVCILTSDNPRTEDPQQIIDDTLPGFLETPEVPYYTFIDRLEAIRWAFDLCKKGDLLVLAGKGHEDYQVLDYGTVYFDEREIILSLSKEKRGEVI